MELCSDGHNEVCYDGRFCPVCEKKDEIEEYKEEVDNLNTQIDKLQEETDNYNDIKDYIIENYPDALI